MRSMTGFGCAASDAAGVLLRAEVRAVNHKHLQVKMRLPSDLGFLEPQVEAAVRKRLDRGSVTVGVHVSSEATPSTVRLNPEIAAAYQREMRKLGKELGLEPEMDLRTVVGLPGVLGGGATERELEREERELLKVVEQALKELGEMREREGTALEADLRKHTKVVRAVIRRIAKRTPRVVREHQTALHKRVQELLGESTRVDPKDLAREVAVLADRADVAEELARLDSHLAQLEVLFEKKGPVGRQLDFLVQEMFREANTIGSKCMDAKVAHFVVDLKTGIERLREQVQNVE